MQRKTTDSPQGMNRIQQRSLFSTCFIFHYILLLNPTGIVKHIKIENEPRAVDVIVRLRCFCSRWVKSIPPSDSMSSLWTAAP